MEDDQSHFAQDFSEVVEVDMDYDQHQENPEYEMVDGEGVSTPFVESTELIDVELYDASPRSPNTTMQSQPAAALLDAYPLPESQFGAHVNVPSVDAVALSSPHPASGEAYSQPSEEQATQASQPEGSEASHPTNINEEHSQSSIYGAPSGHESHPAGDIAEVVEEVATLEPTHFTAKADSAPTDIEHAYDHPDVVNEPQAGVVSADETHSSGVDEQPPVQDTTHDAAEQASGWIGGISSDEPEVAGDITSTSQNGHDGGDGSYLHEGHSSVSALGSSAQIEEHQDDTTKQAEDRSDSTSSKDPHEISDGIFIEPPPGVLVSVLSDSAPKFSLFNRPSSYPAGPSSSTLDDEAQPLTVLFEDNPTLYYEPFCKLFAALRDSSFVIESPHLHEGELVLNFYDLQLSISEDNKYADESIGIHEINMLHGGMGHPGPLRCRIELSYPSFIQRYQTLLADITHPEEEQFNDEVHAQNEGHVETHEDHEEMYDEEGAVADEAEVAGGATATGDVTNQSSTTVDTEVSYQPDVQDRQTDMLQAQALADVDVEDDSPVSQEQYKEVTAVAVSDEYDDNQEGRHDPYAQALSLNEDIEDEGTDELEDEASGEHDGLQHDDPDAEHQETDLPTEYEQVTHLQDDEDDQEDGADAGNPENFDDLDESEDVEQHELGDSAGVYDLPERSAEQPTEVTVDAEPVLQVEAEAGALEDEDTAPAPVIAHAGPDIDLEAEDPEDLDAEFDLEEFADYTPEVNPTVVSSHEGDGDTHGLDDADSMVSSVTLSSTKSSSKRSLDDVFAEDGVDSSEEVVVGSPGSKRPRVV